MTLGLAKSDKTHTRTRVGHTPSPRYGRYAAILTLPPPTRCAPECSEADARCPMELASPKMYHLQTAAPQTPRRSYTAWAHLERRGARTLHCAAYCALDPSAGTGILDAASPQQHPSPPSRIPLVCRCVTGRRGRPAPDRLVSLPSRWGGSAAVQRIRIVCGQVTLAAAATTREGSPTCISACYFENFA